ncbi:MAG: hypothetical protein PHD60_07200 [Clostridia bacterium]|nr:hypothetical protein [Clostridia bacterium]
MSSVYNKKITDCLASGFIELRQANNLDALEWNDTYLFGLIMGVEASSCLTSGMVKQIQNRRQEIYERKRKEITAADLKTAAKIRTEKSRQRYSTNVAGQASNLVKLYHENRRNGN